MFLVTFTCQIMKLFLLPKQSRQLSQYTDYTTGWMGDELWFNSQQGKEFFSTPEHPYQVLEPTRLLFSGYRGLFFQEKSSHMVTLMTHHHKALSLRISGAIRPHTFLHGIQKDRYNFAFYRLTWQPREATEWSDYKIYVCHLLYESCTRLCNGCVPFVIRKLYIFFFWHYIQISSWAQPDSYARRTREIFPWE